MQRPSVLSSNLGTKCFVFILVGPTTFNFVWMPLWDQRCLLQYFYVLVTVSSIDEHPHYKKNQ